MRNKYIQFGEFCDYHNYYNMNLFSNRILINQGNGKFNKKGLVELPYFDGTNMLTSQDFIADDVTGDGKVDLICVANTMNYQSWEIFVYVQQNDGSFKIDKNGNFLSVGL